MPGAQEPEVRESRTLLSDYYGLQRAASPGPEQSSSDDKDEFLDEQPEDYDEVLGNTLSNDPLDREDFELDFYVQGLLSKSNVKELIEMDNAITGEIRTLDNDLQMLVYENYAKFIAATDIIKEMQTKVDDLHSDMEKLKTTIDSLGTYYSAAEQVIDPSRCNIERLLGLSRLVGRLDFLFDLPDRLRSEISKRNYKQAVAMFTNSTKILEQYSLVKSFQEIKKESEQILKDLRQKLRSELQSYENAKGVQLISTATLLLSLDEEPSLLWHDALSSKRDWFLISLEKAKKNAISPSHLLKSLRMCFADDFVEFVTEFKNHFLSSLPKVVSPNVPNQNSTTVSRTIQDDAVVALNSFSRQVFTMYVEDARETLMRIVEDIASINLSHDEHHVQLEILVNEVKSLSAVAAAAESVLPTSQLGARCKEVTDAIMKRTLVSVFTHCHRAILKSVAIYVQGHSPVLPKSDDCVKQIHEHLKSASLDVSLICTYHPQADKLILDLFLNALENVQVLLLGDNGVLHSEQALILSAQKYEIRKSLAGDIAHSTPLIHLRLSKLCGPCQGYALPELFEFLPGLFPSLSASPAFNKRCALLLQLFKETEKALLNASARQTGTVMSLLLREPISVITATPTKSRSSMFAWRNALLEYNQQLLAVYPQSIGESQASRLAVSPGRPMKRNDIHRMFTQTHTIPMFVNIEPSLESLLHTSIKIALKAWIEHIRLQMFTSFQFQQLQIDVYMARISIPVCLQANRSILDTLLDEVLTSAIDNCSENSPELSSNLVEQYGSISK